MRIRRTLLITLAFLLVFSNSAYAATFNSLKLLPENQIQNLKPTNNNEKLSKEELDELYKPTDKVRVVVEVEGEPAITYATKQGVKFAELPKSKQKELQNKNLATQEQVKQSLTNKKVDMKFEHSFTTVFNGFSGIVEYSKVELIENLPGVKSVSISNEYKRPEVELDMVYSKELIEALSTWEDYGYDGTGMVVGVIDSGADPNHKDFVITDEDAVALSEEDVNNIIQNEGLKGKYFNPKVPYGYNYMDDNQEIRDLGPGASEHGMHVGGIVVANGDESNGGIKGVAPEAQMLVLKVFGNDPNMGSTWADIYIKAIDDAIILGADVLNLSLGSPSAFVNADDPEQRAINNAVEHGLLVAISAGNSAHVGNGFFSPYASNPDIGVVGSPGVSYDSLQVASIENSFMDLDAITYKIGEVTGKAPFLSASSVHPNDVEQKEFEVLHAGLGHPEDFEGQDFNGKYALIQRGELAFVDKALNAQEAGAVGVIIYNNEDGFVNMQSDPAIVIPQLFMLKTDGDFLADQILNGETVTISFLGDQTTAPNPLAGQMSDFTSWGVTPNLDFKPEITAPGGNILSTMQNDNYAISSGTSMASPHVAGGAALVLQRVDEHFDLANKDRVQMAKNILMNTAKPVMDKGTVNNAFGFEIPYSPRRQGAGLMQLHAAVSTPVVVTEVNTGEAKVALREVGDQFKFTLEATNFGDETVTYDLDANIQTDLQIFGLLGNAYATGVINDLEAADLAAEIIINGGDTTIEIPAGESVTFDIEVNLEDALVFSVDDKTGNFGYVSPDSVFPNGYFVEGFVTLTDQSDVNPTLVVPYVGFKGDWNAAPIVDALDYDGNDSFYEYTGMLYDDNDSYYYLGYDPFTRQKYTDKIAISPGTNSKQDHIFPILSLLRNAKSLEYYILDKDGKELRKLFSQKYVRKNYYDNGRNQPYRILTDAKWDGTVNGKVVPDGQYFFEIRATIDYPGAEAQSFKIPVKVDTIAPTLNAELNGSVLTIDAGDDYSGIKYIELIINGESQGLLSPETTEIDFGEEFAAGTSITLVAVDHAGNETSFNIGGINDNNPPVIYVNSFATGQIFNTSDITVAGYVEDESEIVEIKVLNQKVDFNYNSALDRYEFETVVTLDDGAHAIRVEAKDAAGNETSLTNTLFVIVDTTAPVIEVEKEFTVNNKTNQIDINVNISDNQDELRLFVNDSEVFYNKSNSGYQALNPFDETVEITLKDLQFGENTFTLELVDIAGNTTVEEITVFREQVSRLSGSNRYATAVEASQNGWNESDVVVLARGDDYADALAGVPLAGKLDAPLLLTQSNKLTEVTKNEIERLGASTVYLLGGEGAISKDVEDALKALNIEVKRLSGKNRIETAVAIAEELVGDAGTNKAVVVNGFNFPDALSVASYAAIEGLPILLTQGNTLSKETEEALNALGVTETLVIGGTVAVSEDVEEAVPNATRISGKNRIATAIEVAKHFDLDVNHYYVATGYQFPDALSTAALAAKEGTGLVLVGNSVSEDLAQFTKDKGLNTLTVVGGTGVISEKVFNELKKLFN